MLSLLCHSESNKTGLGERRPRSVARWEGKTWDYHDVLLGICDERVIAETKESSCSVPTVVSLYAKNDK